MNVVDAFDRSARYAPNATAIIDGHSGRERLLTYADLEAHSRQLASLFARAGLQAGDGVVVMSPMSAELYEILAAAWRLGLVPVFMDPAAGDEHFEQCLGRYPVRGFVGTPAARLRRLTSRALRSILKAFVCGAFFPGARSLRRARYPPPRKDTYSCKSETSE